MHSTAQNSQAPNVGKEWWLLRSNSMCPRHQKETLTNDNQSKQTNRKWLESKEQADGWMYCTKFLGLIFGFHFFFYKGMKVIEGFGIIFKGGELFIVVLSFCNPDRED